MQTVQNPSPGGASSARWAAVIPIGPGETELHRIDDLCHSLAYYGPNGGPVYILNDGADAARLQNCLARHSLQGTIVPHPRAGRGNAWLGRLTSGLFYVYSQISKEVPDYHILKLDTDALITDAFSDRLTKLVNENPHAGMIGSIGLTPSAKKTANWFSHRIYRMGKRFSLWDYRPYFRVNLWGAKAAMRRIINDAFRTGYYPDVAPCGGSYLITAEANRRLNARQELHLPRVIAEESLTEDVFFSIAVYAVGMKVLEQNNPGDLFGVCWKGLPAASLNALAERGNAIIHSVKDHEPFKEDTTRHFFRAIRV